MGMRKEKACGQPADDGFTLVEVLVSMILATTLMTAAVMGLKQYISAQSLAGSANDLASRMRNAAERSLSEGITYCLALDSTNNTYQLFSSACGTGVAKTTVVKAQSAYVTPSFPTVAAQAFTSCPGGPVACVYFYPRGTASSGSVKVCKTSSCSGKVWTVTVEGLSSRVSVA